MKMILRFLLLAAFAAVVFLPVRENEQLVGLLFTGMIALVTVYFMVTYWVSEKRCRRYLDDGETVRFSVFTSRAADEPAQGEAERGRLLITDHRLLFCVKNSGGSVQPRIDMPIGQVNGYELGQVLLVKHGLILSYDRESDADSAGYLYFAVLNMAKKEKDLLEALGWNGNKG